MDNIKNLYLFLYKINGGNIGFLSFPMKYWKNLIQMKKKVQKMVDSDKRAMFVWIVIIKKCFLKNDNQIHFLVPEKYSFFCYNRCKFDSCKAKNASIRDCGDCYSDMPILSWVQKWVNPLPLWVLEFSLTLPFFTIKNGIFIFHIFLNISKNHL